jgi:hypothetical protein
MIFLDKVKEITSKIDSLHVEDPKIYDYWEELASVLSQNELQTIDLLNTTIDEDLILHLSSVFGDVSQSFQSKKFVECLKRLDIKYPHLLLSYMITPAINALEP